MRAKRLSLAVVMTFGLLPGAASAQDPAALAKAGGSFLDADQFANALAQYQQIPETAPAEVLLEKHGGSALALMNMGRVTEASPHVERSTALAAAIGTDQAQVKALNVEGLYLNWLKRGDHGLSALHRAAELAERNGAAAAPALAKVYGSLSTVYQLLEDWERQAYFSQKEFDLNPNPTPVQRFVYHVLRGIAFFELYERDLAETELKRALELSATTKRVRDRAFALGELAYLYWTFDKDADKALPLFEEGIRLAAESKSASMEATWRTNRGNVYRDTGDYARAEADYRHSIRILESGGLSAQTFHHYKNIGQVWRLTGRNAEAAEFLERLIRERGHQAMMRHLWQAHMELASAYAALGQRDRAEASFREMLNVLEEQRNTAILDAFRTGALAHALSAYDPYERYMRFLAGADPPRVHDALDVSERARARGFLEALASVRSALAAKLPAPLLAEESRIRQAISTAQERLRDPDLAKTDRDRVLGELERAEQERDKFLLALRVEHPSLAEARYPTLLDASAVQAQLRPDEIAVAFFLAEPSSFRWVMSREHVVMDLIAGRAAIEKDVTRLRDLLRTPSAGDEVRAASARLGDMLLRGITTGAGRPMVIVPHGVLHYVPFEVLRLEDHMLIERHAVSYAPSLNALVQLRRSPANRAPFRVLAVGNPSVAEPRLGAANDESGASARAGDVENLALLGPLPFAEQELYAIGRTFRDRTRILSGPSARESGLRDAGVPLYPVIHFATHGLVSDVQPKRSGLLLTPEAGEDGLLQMSEIYALGLKANLVVLSACQTALGREITGEGLIGLSRAFFYAGARSVVATLWNLNDRFAAEFVERFYRELNQGHSVEGALRRAKLAYVDHPQYSHPFYWSSLVLLGEGAGPLVSEPITAAWLEPLLAIGLAFGAVTVALAKTRRSG